MGQPQAKPVATSSPQDAKKETLRDSWRDTRKGIMTTFGYTTTAASNVIPSDNIFVPIQQDNILPQIPIGRHHPVPRKGVEDDDKRTMHTNTFYANAFLGQQNAPIWTHPYTIWWGKGWQEPGLLQSYGMNIAHCDEADVAYGPGDPTSVGHIISTDIDAIIDPSRYTSILLTSSHLSSRQES